jgi:hypothetical protein
MTEPADNLPPAPPPPVMGRDFYVTGGTLRPDAPSYVERRADNELCEGLLNGEFCYVLTSRQMGKSSLMVRTVKRLRETGAAVAVLDLTAIGQNLTIGQWYDGLISRLGQQLDLEDELLDFWEAHPELGPLQRWLTAIEKVVLGHYSGRVIIFVDEIDIVRSLPFSTDEFFAAIRECYNRRSREPAFGRLAFGLLGVATPTDLIRDTRMTPFNIGRRIELNDFTPDEVAPLARGLGADETTAGVLLSRILYWTGGHPYLTQRLCRALADGLQPGSANVPPLLPSLRVVDRLAEQLFLSRQARDRDDNLIFVRERILRSEGDVAGLLYLYRRIRLGERVADDETNPLISILRLAGITRNVDGWLHVRNRIYSHVFDLGWIQTNMPEPELRRQRKARHRGVAIGLSIAVVLVFGYAIFWPKFKDYRQAQISSRIARDLENSYRELEAYDGTFESTTDLGVGGLVVPIRGSGKIQYRKPEFMSLSLKSEYSTPVTQVDLIRRGNRFMIQAPDLKQYKIQADSGPTNSPLPPDAPPPPRRNASPPEWEQWQKNMETQFRAAFTNLPGGPRRFGPPHAGRSVLDVPRSLARQIGPMRVLPVCRWFLEPAALDRFQKDARRFKFEGDGELNGQAVRRVSWEHASEELLRDLGVRVAPEEPFIPVTAWVSASDHRVLQIRLDLSHWAKQLLGDRQEILVTSLVLTETHKQSQTPPMPELPEVSSLHPPPDSLPVEEFVSPSGEPSTLESLKRLFSKMIPARLPQATPEMIDLTEYYNAPLAQAWHPGLPNNSLDALPTGLLQFGDATFDVRGLVQLGGKELQRVGGRYPQQVTGIRVQQRCHSLHFLHAAGWKSRDGTRIGAYVVHYLDGREQRIPIVYGEDVRDWNADSDPSGLLKRSSLVWKVTNNAGYHVRLFKTTWENPWPENEIVSIDYISEMKEAAPYLIAITAGK